MACHTPCNSELQALLLGFSDWQKMTAADKEQSHLEVAVCGVVDRCPLCVRLTHPHPPLQPPEVLLVVGPFSAACRLRRLHDAESPLPPLPCLRRPQTALRTFLKILPRNLPRLPAENTAQAASPAYFEAQPLRMFHQTSSTWYSRLQVRRMIDHLVRRSMLGCKRQIGLEI